MAANDDRNLIQIPHTGAFGGIVDQINTNFDLLHLAILSKRDGKSAYEVWKDQEGNENKSVEEFLASLRESGFTTQAVDSLPTTNISTTTIYAVPAWSDGLDQEDDEPDMWAEYIRVDNVWKLLAKHDGSGLSGALADIGDLKLRNEPIVFTASKTMNAFIKTLFVDKNRYEQTQGATVNDIYAAWNSTTRHLYLYDAPYAGNIMLDIDMSSEMKSVYCCGVSSGMFVYLEIDTAILLNSASIASIASASNPRPKLTSWATSKSFDPRSTNGGFTESPVLNKFISKIWVEIADDLDSEDMEYVVGNIIDKMVVYTLSSIYDSEEGKYKQNLVFRRYADIEGLGMNFSYSSYDESTEIAFTHMSTSNPFYKKVTFHAVVDWQGLRTESVSPNTQRTYLTHKAYDKNFWKTPISDSIGNDSKVAFSQLGAKGLFEEIERIKDSGISETISYDSNNLVDGYWNLASVSIGAKITQTAPTEVSTWYSLAPVEVKKGDVVTLFTKGGSNGRAWGLTDKDKYLKSVASAGVDYTANPATIEVGEDGYLYVNHQADQDTAANKNKFSLSISRNNLANLFEDVEKIKEKESEGSETVFSKIFNPKVDLKKSQLRVLDIGNSFTNNALGVYTGGTTNILNSLVQAADLDLSGMCLYKAVMSGASFKEWYNVYHGIASYSGSTKKTYSVTKSIGGTQDNQAIDGNPSSSYDSDNNVRFASALEDCQWDLILIHQSSSYSADDISTLEGDGEGGYLRQFIRLIRTLQPSAAIGFLFTHVGNDDAGGDTESKFIQMCKTTKQICSRYGIDFIIPVGAALENLRASSLNTTSHNFCEDNHHLAAGLGKYVAAATYFQALFAPRYGVSVLGNTYNSIVINSDIIGTHTSYSNNYVDVTPSNAPVAQMCAILAVNDMWTVNNPDGVIL